MGSHPLRERWIAAATTLATDPTAKLPCPACGLGPLDVIDAHARRPADKIERHLICPSCKATNSILMNRPSTRMNSTDTYKLHQFFGAYFHQDWVEEHPTPEDVIVDFSSRSTPAEVAELARLIEQFCDEHSDDDVLSKGLLQELGCFVHPGDTPRNARDWLLEVARWMRALTQIAAGTKPLIFTPPST